MDEEAVEENGEEIAGRMRSMQKFPQDSQKIAQMVQTRSPTQIQTLAKGKRKRQAEGRGAEAAELVDELGLVRHVLAALHGPDEVEAVVLELQLRDPIQILHHELGL